MACVPNDSKAPSDSHLDIVQKRRQIRLGFAVCNRLQTLPIFVQNFTVDKTTNLDLIQSMQVALTEENQKLIEDYRKLVQTKTPTYNASATVISNSLINFGVRGMIKSLKENHANSKKP